MGVAADGFPELGADEHEGVLLVVALLVESHGAEVMLGGPEQPLHPLHPEPKYEEEKEESESQGGETPEAGKPGKPKPKS